MAKEMSEFKRKFYKCLTVAAYVTGVLSVGTVLFCIGSLIFGY